jgi:hypothetical protein
MSEKKRKHVWISNPAFASMTGIVKVCMDCGLALDKGERLDPDERWCRGRMSAFHPFIPIKEKA